MKAQQMKVIVKLVVLQVATVSNKLWNLHLSHCPSHGLLDFTFTSTWAQFVTDNRVLKGDILVFPKLKFMVYVFNFEGLSIDALPRSPPSMTCHDVDAEEEDLVMPHTSNASSSTIPKEVVKHLIGGKLFHWFTVT